MRITLGTTQYRWTPGSRTINLFTLEPRSWGMYWAETDVISFGYDKPDNTTTAIEALDAILTRLTDEAMDRHPAGRDTVSQEFDVSLCADCIAFDANGTVGDDPDYTPDKPPMALLDGYLIGPDETGHECEGHFSWDSCDGCGTFLGGNRYCYMAVPK